MSLEKNTSCSWFQSDTRLGRVFVGVESDDAVRNNLAGPHRVFQQTALLEKSELFVQAIELWQEVDLDLSPCDTPTESALRFSLTLKEDAQGEAQGIAVIFPSDSLARLKPLSEELESVLNINGSDISLQVELDDFEIPIEEFDFIETGAVVVLPKSYQTDWQVFAKSITPELALDVSGKLVCTNDESTLLFTTNNTSDRPTANRESLADLSGKTTRSVTVQCGKPCTVPFSSLLGRSDIQLPLDISELSLICDKQVLAHGSLLNYGRGSVLAVSELVVAG